MSKEVVYGLSGFCENCDETHNHPLHNIVEVIDTQDVETPEELGFS